MEPRPVDLTRPPLTARRSFAATLVGYPLLGAAGLLYGLLEALLGPAADAAVPYILAAGGAALSLGGAVGAARALKVLRAVRAIARLRGFDARLRGDRILARVALALGLLHALILPGFFGSAYLARLLS